MQGVASIASPLMDPARTSAWEAPPRTLERGGEGFPERLSRIVRSPERLRVRGVLGPPTERRVALVGQRHSDDYGLRLARDMGRDLVRAGVCVVSGGAEGIDGAAHAAALDAGGRTIAVLGSGVDVVYPAVHRGLFQRILEEGGALLSELADGAPPARWTFPERNRIVSGLSEAVVVIRAGSRSGALITAQWARQQGVPVLAVPGDVYEEGSQGPHALLRSGARLATSAADVLAALGIEGQLRLPLAEEPNRQDEAASLVGEEKALWAALGRAPRHADALARDARLTAAEALSGLLLLELRGLCEQLPGHLFQRRD